MSARRAFVWLFILTLCLVALTVVVHFVPMALPIPRAPVPTNGIVVPSSDTPTLTASVTRPSHVPPAA